MQFVSQDGFWTALEGLIEKLNEWDCHEPRVSPEIFKTCEKIAWIMNGEDALNYCADPQNAKRIQIIREKYGERWSLINSRIEFQYAEEIFDTIETLETFFEHVHNHSMFKSGSARANTEIQLLQRHNIELQGLKVAMIGPGAIPYTALAFAQAGAHVTGLDCYQPACEWLNKWFGKLLKKGTYTIKQTWAQEENYTQYDVVIVASMLIQRHAVIEAIERSAPHFVFVRSTISQHPLSLFAYQADKQELVALKSAQLISDTRPTSGKVGIYSLLYQYPNSLFTA